MDEIILYVLVGLNVAIMGWLIFLTARTNYLAKKAEILFSDNLPGNLSQTLRKYLEDVKAVEDHCFKLDKSLKKIQRMSEAGIQKVGFVRYNPFGDVGGNQSFSLANLNHSETGFVISSIHSREGTRVYAKTVVNGKSEYNLSDEEQKAIEIARHQK